MEVFRIFSLISGDTHVRGATFRSDGHFRIGQIAASARENCFLSYFKYSYL